MFKLDIGSVMSNDSLMTYLEKYISAPKILTLEQLSDNDKKALPNSWLDILSHNGKTRCSKALSYWSEFKTELEQVIEYLEKNLVSVDLISHEPGYSLVYGVKSSSGSDTIYYEGRNPKEKSIPNNVLKVWNLIPESITKFYDEVHNGWFDLASRSMGLSPVEKFFFLDEDEWSIIDELNNLTVDLEKTLALYSNGMGGYLCLELTKKGNNALLWFSSEEPMEDLDFWPMADTWTVMGFED